MSQSKKPLKLKQEQEQQQQQQDRPERNFLNSIRSKQTKRTYLFYFERYRKFTNGNMMMGGDSRIIENKVVDFLLAMKSKGLSSASLKNHYNALAHFYIMNDIILNRKKISKFIYGEERKKYKNTGYSSEQIHKLLDISDERTKAIILIYASTGMRLGALPALKIGDLQLIINNEDLKLFRITVYQGYKEEYITFCTPECTKVIESYLLYRERCGEEIMPNSALIREQFEATDPFRVNHPKHISLDTIARTLRLRGVQAGLIGVNHSDTNIGSKYRKDIPLIHGFRRFFNTALMNADVNFTFKELLMGHSVKLDDVYYDKNSEKSRNKLREEYTKAIDYLTINEENRLRIKVQKLTVEKSQIDKLEAQINELSALIK